MFNFFKKKTPEVKFSLQKEVEDAGSYKSWWIVKGTESISKMTSEDWDTLFDGIISELPDNVNNPSLITSLAELVKP